jgi:hypothetical protein
MRTSPCKATDPRKLEPAALEWKWLHCTSMGCESGRQDSNLRPLVPQTSPCFRARRRVQKEWFRGELVGMTTRAGAMESNGILSTRTRAYWKLLPSPADLDLGHSGGRRARRASEAAGSGDRTLAWASAFTATDLGCRTRAWSVRLRSPLRRHGCELCACLVAL